MRRPDAVLISRLQFCVDANGCWIWTGGTTKPDGSGYGVMWDGEKTTTAHRLSFEIHHHVLLLPGIEVDHLCRVPLCIRPAHLEAVTRRENMRRQRGFLTYDNDRVVAAEVIRLRGQGLTFTQISNETGVTRSRCHRLAHGWRQQTEEVV